MLISYLIRGNAYFIVSDMLYIELTAIGLNNKLVMNFIVTAMLLYQYLTIHLTDKMILVPSQILNMMKDGSLHK